MVPTGSLSRPDSGSSDYSLQVRARSTARLQVCLGSWVGMEETMLLRSLLLVDLRQGQGVKLSPNCRLCAIA